MIRIKKILIGMLLFLLFINANSALGAQEGQYNLGDVLVSATRTPQYAARTGSAVTVISGRELERGGKQTVAEALKNVTGVSVSQSGSLGGATYVYMRGAKPGHTLVLIDGMEINDPSNAERSFNFAHLTTDNIERIEIVRGPQSTLYGSDAIGGVINIITKKGSGEPKAAVEFETGSYKTQRRSGTVSGSNGRLNYSASVSRAVSAGISRASDGQEDDGYKNLSFASRLGMELSEESEMFFITRYTDAEMDIDDGAYDDDPNYTADSKQLGAKLGFNQKLSDVWDYSAGLYYANQERKNRDLSDSVDTADDLEDKYTGYNRKFETQHNVLLFESLTQTVGVEYEQESAQFDYRSGSFTDRMDRKTVDAQGYYTQSQWQIKENLSAVFGIRIDDHERFGKATTYKASTVYYIPQSSTHLKANIGTGFKSPSLYQLYSSYGNTGLTADKSTGYDLFVGQDFCGGRIFCSGGYFFNNFKDMIDFDLSDWKYKNIGHAQTSGIETETKLKISEDFTVAGNYTYLKTKDKDTGNELSRRPEHKAGMALNWQVFQPLNMDISANYVGRRWDNSTNTQRLKQYCTVDYFLNYKIVPQAQVFLKVINLFDKKYHDVRGFDNLERTAYLGIRGEI